MPGGGVPSVAALARAPTGCHSRYPLSVPDENSPEERASFVVCGDNPMAYRLVDELATTVRRRRDRDLRLDSGGLGAEDRRYPARTGRGVRPARSPRPSFELASRRPSALALVDQDDAANVEAALLAQELNPDLRDRDPDVQAEPGRADQRAAQRLRGALRRRDRRAGLRGRRAGRRGHRRRSRSATGPWSARRAATPTGRGRVAGLAVMGPRGTEPEILPPDADERGRPGAGAHRAKPAPPRRPAPPAAWCRAAAALRPPGCERARRVPGIYRRRHGGAGLGARLGHGQLDRGRLRRPHRRARWRRRRSERVGHREGRRDPADLGQHRADPGATATMVDALVKARLEREAGGLLRTDRQPHRRGRAGRRRHPGDPRRCTSRASTWWRSSATPRPAACRSPASWTFPSIIGDASQDRDAGQRPRWRPAARWWSSPPTT